MPGLYSIQTHPTDPKAPSCTFYRVDSESAVDCVHRQCATGQHQFVFLRHAESAWDVYDSSGRIAHLCAEISLRQRIEVPTRVRVDLDVLDEAARTNLRNKRLTRLAATAGHSYEPAARLTNFRHIFHDLLGQASAEDATQLTLVESRTFHCRVVGLYAEVLKLSAGARDRWLDVFKMVRDDVPVDHVDYLEALRHQLSNARHDELIAMANMAMERAGVAADDRSYLSFRLGEINLRENFADALVTALGKFFVPHPDTGVEFLPHQQLTAFSPEIVSMLRKAVKPGELFGTAAAR